MIARVRPSLNGAREALKTWDEASVVWPRFEVRLYFYSTDFFDFTQQHRHHFLLTKEGFRAGGNEIKSSKAAGSECGSSHLRGHFRLALCTAVQRDEKAETKTVKLVFIILPISRVICTTAVLIVIGKPRKPADLNPHLFRFSFHHLPF